MDGMGREYSTNGAEENRSLEKTALNSSLSIIGIIKSRRLKRTGHVARMACKRNACRVLLGKPEGQRLLGRQICIFEYVTKMNLRKVGWGDVDWTDLAQGKEL
jgi:selenophosphate synthase